jgi:phosphoribosylglycinamide formyltransferase-1
MLGIITYNHPHLKTEQVISGLLGRYKLKIFAVPYKDRPERQILFNHRLDQSKAIHPRFIAQKHNLDYTEDGIYGCDLYLITGAGIIHNVKGKVINCHPGIIPAVRGLDSFKWAIYNDIDLGNTLHYINDEVDSGEIISVIPTHVYKTDTIETLARRHYENEINALINFEYHLNNKHNSFEEIKTGEATKRMPYATETVMMTKAEYYIKYHSLWQTIYGDQR